jgi:predicted metal-dependent phosphoesterase TrpH
LIIDLHAHTSASFDGFTSPQELRDVCLRRGISVVAVTEHDEICRVDPAPFTAAGLVLVPGCEFTTDRGAHIIGLFVRAGLARGADREAVFAHIRSQGGLVVLPHPFKPGSGYFTFYGEDRLLEDVAFVEMLNGGWDSSEHVDSIRDVCARHGLRMIASSDAHRPEHVGLCATRVDADPAEALADPRDFLKRIRQEQIELLVDETRLRQQGRRVLPVQRTSAYQFLLRLTPSGLRRWAKLIHYRLRRRTAVPMLTYRRFPA